MKQKTLFRGIATALATPMTSSGAIDYDAYGRLIDWQIESGVAGLVTCGTTGEASTMTAEEHRQTIAFAVKRAAGRVPVIAGTGANCTEKAVELTRFACAAGADACLVVTPYYNKATQNGLKAHYKAIAKEVNVPIILYNVPSRTGTRLAPQTVVDLCHEVPNIVGVKDATGDISEVAELMSLAKGTVDVYSGNDDQIVPVLSLGGKGVISVLSNILPKETHDMVASYLEGDVVKSCEMQLKYFDLVKALFCEVNPIPVKKALNLMGMEVGSLRLPLTEMEDANAKRLEEEMRKAGVIK